MLRTLYRGLLYAGRLFGGSLFTAGLTPTDESPSVVRWSREPGRTRAAPEPGRTRTAREPGRCLAVSTPHEWAGTFYLPTGGTVGGKRRFALYFGGMEEISVNSETLTGTPTVTLTADDLQTILPVVSSVAYNVAPMTVVVNGRSITAAVGTVLLFTVTANTGAPDNDVADPGDYTLSFHAETSGGSVLEPTATLTLE